MARTPASPDDLRAAGWMVAVHNDYRLGGVAHTFWLLTKGDRCVKGEGLTDADALNQIRSQLNPIGIPSGQGPKPGRARGGHARAQSLGPERRSEIARKASLARWRKARDA